MCKAMALFANVPLVYFIRLLLLLFWPQHEYETRRDRDERRSGNIVEVIRKVLRKFFFSSFILLLLINMRTHITKAILRCERCESAECRGRALIQA